MPRIGSGGETAPAEAQQRPDTSRSSSGGSSTSYNDSNDDDDISDEEAVRRVKDQYNEDQTGDDTGVVDDGDDDSSSSSGTSRSSSGSSSREQDTGVVNTIKDRINDRVTGARERVSNARPTRQQARDAVRNLTDNARDRAAAISAIEQGVESDDSFEYRDQAQQFEQQVVDEYGLEGSDQVRVEYDQEEQQFTASLTSSGVEELRREELRRLREEEARDRRFRDRLGDGLGAPESLEAEEAVQQQTTLVKGADGQISTQERESVRDSIAREIGVQSSDVELERTDEGFTGTATVRREPARPEERFGDFAIVNPVSGNRVEDELRRLSQGYEETVGQYIDTAVESDVNPFTGQLQREIVQEGLRQTGNDELAAEIEQQEELSEEFVKSFNVGAASLADIPGTAAGVKEGVELGGYLGQQGFEDIETSIREESVTTENTGQAGADLGEATVQAASGFKTNLEENPVRVGGQLAGSLVGSTAIFKGAAAIGPRSSAVARYGIQPGEEIATAAASRAFPKTAARLGGTVDIEEAAIVGARGARRRVSNALGADLETQIRSELTGSSRGQADLTFGQSRGVETSSTELESEIQEELDRMERAQRGEFLDASGQSGLDTETTDRIGETSGVPSQRYNPVETQLTPTDDLRRLVDVEDGLRAESNVGNALGRRTRAEASSFGDEDTLIGVEESTFFDTRSFEDSVQGTDIRQDTRLRQELDIASELGIRTDVDTRSRLNTDTETELDTRTDVESELAQELGIENELETEIESLFETETETETEADFLFGENPRQRNQPQALFGTQDKLFSSGIADVDDFLNS